LEYRQQEQQIEGRTLKGVLLRSEASKYAHS
jgi:hypothetical protein